MNNIRIVTIIFVLLCIGRYDGFSQTVINKIEQYFNVFTTYPQEKLYLHLDKPYYAAGENVFFKAYLTEAIRHTSQARSNFIYVELLDGSDHVVLRKKIKRDESGFQGSLQLVPDIPAGNYYIRAYTHWMQNLDKEYFYSRQLRIGNALDRSILSTISYTVSEEGDKCQATVRFTNEYGHPMKQISVTGLIMENGKKGGSFSRKSNEQGEIMFDLPVNKQFKNRSVDVAFKDAAYNYSRSFFVPALGSEKNEFALSFFPEGGDLLAGCRQRIAFKGQKTDGSHCHLQGTVLDEKGDTITTFQTEHDGMGVLSLAATFGSRYVVRATQDGTVYRTFALPEAKEHGQQLSVMQRKNHVNYSVLSAGEITEGDTLYLVAHTRGKLALIVPLNTNTTTGRFPDTMLGEGINELLLTNRQGQVLSRRLVFKAPENKLNVSAGALPASTTPRQKISIPFKVTDQHNAPVQGSFSVSVTDWNLVSPDSLGDNIRSYFLLTSDLKGYVESPGYYFYRQDTQTDFHADLLMLTHGWTRFRHNSLAELPTLQLDYYIEGGQTIGGRTVNMVGGKSKNTPVILIAPTHNITAIGKSDENGNFLFNNLNFKDTVTFVAQARAKSKMFQTFLRIDSVPFPDPYNKYPRVMPGEEKKYQDYDKLIGNSYIEEGGMRVIRLNEVTVTARKKDSGPRGLYDGLSDYTYDEEFITKRFGGITGYQALQRLPGMKFDGVSIRISSYSELPLYIIDDMRYEDGQDIMMNTNASDIKYIEIVKGVQASFLGPEAAGGAIIIKLKSGTEIKREASPGLIMFTQIGYSDCIEFYSPVYDTPQQKGSLKKDIRSTVYWNPNVQTDEAGEATLEFYAPDNLISPHLVIEGILPDGTLLEHSQ